MHVIRERAASDWGFVTRAGVVPAEGNWVTRVWARARTEGAVAAGEGGRAARRIQWGRWEFVWMEGYGKR